MRLAALLAAIVPSIAHAQFLPERGPTGEQQEIANVLLLAPEATVLGAFLGGGAVFLVTRECCTEDKDSDNVKIEPVAIGAGIGAAIATTWAVIAISDNYHPGNFRYAVIGGVLGSGLGAAVFFGGPEVEKSSDDVLRFVTFLFLPGLATYLGWHLESGGFYNLETRPRFTAERHIGLTRRDAAPIASTFSIRF